MPSAYLVELSNLHFQYAAPLRRINPSPSMQQRHLPPQSHLPHHCRIAGRGSPAGVIFITTIEAAAVTVTQLDQGETPDQTDHPFHRYLV